MENTKILRQEIRFDRSAQRHHPTPSASILIKLPCRLDLAIKRHL
jgi:hypothetical protein